MSYILLVEDNQTHADMTIRILASAGYEVKHVLRGFDGAQLARKRRPNVILMDFDLPDINGRTMAFILKKQLGANTAPPIIAVTARAGEDEMRMASHFGCAAFVSKPFLPEDLLTVIARFFPPPPVATPTATGTASAVPATAVSPASVPATPTTVSTSPEVGRSATVPQAPASSTPSLPSTEAGKGAAIPQPQAPAPSATAVTKPLVAPAPSPAPTGQTSPASSGSAPGSSSSPEINERK
jgi:CheY-like chemotaxis protein